MGQTQSNYDVTGLIQIMEAINSGTKINGDDLKNEIIKATEDRTDLVPNSLSDMLLLVLTVVTIILVVVTLFTHNRVKKMEMRELSEAKASHLRILTDHYKRMGRTAVPQQAVPLDA